MCSVWFSLSVIATVICVVSGAALRSSAIGFSDFSAIPDYSLSQPETGRSHGRSEGQYIRTRRRIQGGPPRNFRPQDVFQIDAPNLNTPDSQLFPDSNHRNVQPLEMRNPPRSQVDELRVLPIRNPFEEVAAQRNPLYAASRPTEEMPSFQKLEPILHQKIRPPVTYRLPSEPHYIRSPDDTRPATVLRYPGEPSPNQASGAFEISPNAQGYEQDSVRYQPHHGIQGTRQNQEFFETDDNREKNLGVQEGGKKPISEQERAQISQPHFDDFLRKQQEELQLYRRLKSEKLRQEQEAAEGKRSQQQQHQEEERYYQPQQQHQSKQYQYKQHKQRHQQEEPRHQEQLKAVNSPLFYDEVVGVQQPPRNSEPELDDYQNPEHFASVEKINEKRKIVKKETPRPSPHSYKTREPVVLKPVYSKDQPPSFEDRSNNGRLSHNNEVLDHLPEYQETFEVSGESKEKRQAHHDGGYMDNNGLEFAAAASAAEHAHGSGDGRLTFQLHGQKGPHSYRFGFDTGKGPHRQFRYEERDNHGAVKGRYGYYDSHGKLQMYNYSAHPEHGYEAAPAH
ncbi:glutactin-like [Hyalella azteca]|uniref:Glutactin-like n=1 Tax=Hyalella azteca TaxID=294128 RepID=A0A8B7PF99_HYAAZ|nr:glutactin-like [Hyalella azteca]